MSDSLGPHGILESRPEYCSGQLPSPGDLPNPGIKPRSPALQVDSLPTEPQVKPIITIKFKCLKHLLRPQHWHLRRSLKAELLRMEGISYIEPMIFSSDGHNSGFVSSDGRSIFSLMVTGPLAMAPSISDLLGGQRYQQSCFQLAVVAQFQ